MPFCLTALLAYTQVAGETLIAFSSLLFAYNFSFFLSVCVGRRGVHQFSGNSLQCHPTARGYICSERESRKMMNHRGKPGARERERERERERAGEKQSMNEWTGKTIITLISRNNEFHNFTPDSLLCILVETSFVCIPLTFSDSHQRYTLSISCGP